MNESLITSGINPQELSISDIMKKADEIQLTSPLNAVKNFVKQINDRLEQCCKNYITEKNISLSDWKEYGTMNVYTDNNNVNIFPYSAGNIKYKDEIIVKFGKDSKTDFGFYISETWRKYDK